jgi:hypothetical protein
LPQAEGTEQGKTGRGASRPTLYGLKEIATAIGEDRGKVTVWHGRDDKLPDKQRQPAPGLGRDPFPKPDHRPAAGPMWEPKTIEPWIERYLAKQVGRRVKKASKTLTAKAAWAAQAASHAQIQGADPERVTQARQLADDLTAAARLAQDLDRDPQLTGDVRVRPASPVALAAADRLATQGSTDPAAAEDDSSTEGVTSYDLDLAVRVLRQGAACFADGPQWAALDRESPR